MVSNGWYAILRTPRVFRNSPNHQCAQAFFGERANKLVMQMRRRYRHTVRPQGPPSTMKFASHCW